MIALTTMGAIFLGIIVFVYEKQEQVSMDKSFDQCADTCRHYDQAE